MKTRPPGKKPFSYSLFPDVSGPAPARFRPRPTPGAEAIGEPSQKQIDDCIAFGLSRGYDEAAILRDLLTLERMTDADLFAVEVLVPGYVPPAEGAPQSPPTPSIAPSIAASAPPEQCPQPAKVTKLTKLTTPGNGMK